MVSEVDDKPVDDSTCLDPNYGTIDDVDTTKRSMKSKRKVTFRASVTSNPGEQLVRSFCSEEVNQAKAQLNESSRCTGNVEVLAVTAVLFAVITFAQVAGAFAADSEVLKADCVSMAVDTMSYFLNMIAEFAVFSKYYRHLQLIIPAFSITILVYFTVQLVIEDALPSLRGEVDNDKKVNPYIILGFAVWGIFFDVICLLAFAKNEQKNKGSIGVNMMAAFMHVAADFARSIATMIGSIMILWFEFDGVTTDAWACVVVAAMILMGAAYAFAELIKDLALFMRTSK